MHWLDKDVKWYGFKVEKVLLITFVTKPKFLFFSLMETSTEKQLFSASFYRMSGETFFLEYEAGASLSTGRISNPRQFTDKKFKCSEKNTELLLRLSISSLLF